MVAYVSLAFCSAHGRLGCMLFAGACTQTHVFPGSLQLANGKASTQARQGWVSYVAAFMSHSQLKVLPGLELMCCVHSAEEHARAQAVSLPVRDSK
jgi:hypothetical protein